MDDFRNVMAVLLGREAISPDNQLMRACTKGKSIMVTGAGGSIGSELCRQLCNQEPATIILFERSECALYEIEGEIRGLISAREEAKCIKIVPILGSIRNRELVEKTIQRFRVDTIYHAAAYKQVPMLERNVIAGIQNNVFGTLVMARAAEKLGVENFILISTDKAVRPVNIMGATKRIAEQILQSLNALGGKTRFSMVRFGNVLGSSGSVLPLFRKQILSGGPVTVTHPDVTRYFMTVEEAAQLVIQAGALARGGDVFVLDMHKPVRIIDMARKLITLLGYQVCCCREKASCDCERGIAISYTGLRDGEKLAEEIMIGKAVSGTAHPKIMRTVESSIEWPVLRGILERLEFASKFTDLNAIRETLAAAVEGFGGRVSIREADEFAVLAPVSEESAEFRQETVRLAVINQ